MDRGRHPRYKRVIAGAIWTMGAAVVLFALLRPAPATGGGLGPGNPAPDFILPTPEGEPVQLADLLGRPVVINFWATWCPPCRAEMPDLEAAYQANRAAGLAIVAVNLDESKVAVDAFRQRYGLSFTLVIDDQSRVARLYDVIPLPTTYFIDARGIIRAKQAGQLRPDQIRQHLSRIMPGGGADG